MNRQTWPNVRVEEKGWTRLTEWVRESKQQRTKVNEKCVVFLWSISICRTLTGIFVFGHMKRRRETTPDAICNRVSPFSVVCTININYCLWHACDTSRLRCVWENTPLSHFHRRRKRKLFNGSLLREREKKRTRPIEIGNCYFRYCDTFVVLFCAQTLLLKRRNIISNAYLIRSKRAFFPHQPHAYTSDIVSSVREKIIIILFIHCDVYMVNTFRFFFGCDVPTSFARQLKTLIETFTSDWE